MVSEPVDPGRLPATEPTLAEMMRRARERISFTTALAICGISVVGLAIVLAFGASHWRIALLFVALGSFGGWTLADHEQVEGPSSPPFAWRLLQGVSGFLGVAAIFILLLTFLGSALGLWIS